MFGFITKSKAADLVLKALSFLPTAYGTPNGIITYGNNDATSQLNGYATNDDLYSIVRKIAKTCKRIPLYAYEVKDEKSFSKYMLIKRKVQQTGNYTNKSIWDLKDLQYKSTEIIGENDKVQMLLDSPNDYQSKDEFYEAAFSFPLLTGRELIYLNIYDQSASKGQPYAMTHLPPNGTYPIISKELTNLSRRILSWVLTIYGNQIPIEINGDKEAVLLRKYFNPNYDYSGSELLGLSPLSAAFKTLTQIGNERDYANRALLNAGAEGFISNEDDDFNIETWGSVKEDILKELGAIKDRSASNVNAKKLGALLGKWKYTQIGISPVDMALIDQGKITFKKMCNVYGVSDVVFNNDSASTESNVKEMVTQMYTNVVIPEVTSLRDTLNAGLLYRKDELGKLNPRFTDKKRVIDYDMSDISELQEDQTAIATRFSTAPAFRVNDWYEAMGWGRLDDPNADVVLIKQGYMPLADVTAPVGMTAEEIAALNKAAANDYK